MGGGTSRFAETDWPNATGRLKSSEETIDGAPPTSEYGVYYLQKRSVNQRDFDVTDAQANLLYTTRYIEGTLAWFDVLGRGIDDYLLRVQVDISRRYWVIYRFGIPAYAGQFADMDATSRLRTSRGESQPCLFKRSCITVTWARFHAVVNNYGPSPPDDELEDDDDDDDNGNEEKREAKMWFEDGYDPKKHGGKKKKKNKAKRKNKFWVDGNTGDSKEDLTSLTSFESEDESVTSTGSSRVEALAIENGDASPTKDAPNEENAGDEEKPMNDPATEKPSEEKDKDEETQEKVGPQDEVEEAEEALADVNLEKAGSEPVLNRVATPSKKFPEPKLSTLASSSTTSSTSCDGEDWQGMTSSIGGGGGGVEESKEQVDDNMVYHGKTVNKSTLGKATSLASILDPLKPTSKLEANNGAFTFADAEGNMGAATTLEDAAQVAHVPRSRQKQWKKWLQQQAQATMSLMPVPPNPLEGSLQLDQPILKCEEINSIMGQHQTMLIGSEEAKILKKEELEEAKKTGTDAYRPESVIRDSVTPEEQQSLLASQQQQIAEATAEGKTFPRIRKFAKWVQDTSRRRLGSTDSMSKDGLEHTISFESVDTFEHNNVELSERGSERAPTENGTQPPAATTNNEEGLVGFWSWENTMRVHKIKMHVAEGSDLALHVILAIVTNQLRMERNVIVSTV